MTTVSHVPHDDMRHHHEKPNPSDDMSDVTPPTRGNGSIKDKGMVSKVVKFRFKATAGKGGMPIDPSLIHSHWIDAIQETFGLDVEIINNKSQHLDRIDLLQWSNNTLLHQKHFKIYHKSTGRDRNKKITSYILHRILTNESISTIKNAPKIRKILNDHDCFLTEHQWDETTWDTATIGFVTNIDPSFYNTTQAHTKFHTYLQQRKNEINETRIKIKIPTFKMVFSSPTIYSLENNRTSTKAYSIEVKHSEQIEMMRLLKSLLSDNLGVFVPHTMRYKYPEGYEKAIKFQTWQLTNHRTIVLQNINDSTMYYLEPYIKSIKGVKDLIPAIDAEYTGRHNILTEKNDFNTIREHLIRSLQDWYTQHVPSDALPKEGKFPGPPRVKPIFRDTESSGENSWVSRSSASFMSMDLSMVQDDDYFSTSQAAVHAYTYATATTKSLKPLTANKTNLPDDETKEVISDITGTRSDGNIQKQKLEIEQLLEQHKHEKAEAQAIMAAQQQEIQRLTDAYRQSNAAFEEVSAELRKQRTQVHDLITEKLSLADKQRNEEMKAMRHEMMMAMKEMLQNTQHNPSESITNRTNHPTKRPQQGDATPPEDNDTYDKRQEKRVNRRKTPTKKLIFEEEHISEELMTQYESQNSTNADDASSVSE